MFSRDHGLIIACDVDSIDALVALVETTRRSSVVVGYKIGFSLALRYGLPQVVGRLRNIDDRPVIYDHQKAGTDIPQMGALFANCCQEAGIDGVIVFPQAGPETLASFVRAIEAAKMTPIVGGVMTHPKYLQADGGYIADTAPAAMYGAAISIGVTHFVLPGNKPDTVKSHLASSLKAPTPISVMMPGIGSQGGSVRAAFDACGQNRAYAIVGSAIYAASDPLAALMEFSEQVGQYG